METTPTFEELISSKPYKFTIGPNKREFVMHSALVAAQSRAFGRFVNSGFKEAEEFHTELKSVSEETFVLFSQYAYTGDYELLELNPRPRVDVQEVEAAVRCYDSPLAAEPEPAVDPGWGLEVTGKKRKKKQSVPKYTYSRTDLWKDFTLACAIAVEPPPKRPGAVVDNGNVLLSHAQLYVFANCYGISRLSELSFDRLGKALLEMKVTAELVADIIELLSYCYDEPTPERLRNHLVLYAACMADELWSNIQFKELVTTHGDFAAALLGVMIEGQVR
ncbi:hypothetical protein B0T25DRAFT_632492 [Lasiosphaeria hispida]|uniref:BTB domain-containing protein n=1 Tax=Lasiosphaeria hispida TaxID=260671 RepID=A0AAJ0HDX3_9PEZI|nr:hypothetical protein B0T25DRAFT_632492 [Lasiosphaeria hispida]